MHQIRLLNFERKYPLDGLQVYRIHSVGSEKPLERWWSLCFSSEISFLIRNIASSVDLFGDSIISSDSVESTGARAMVSALIPRHCTARLLYCIAQSSSLARDFSELGMRANLGRARARLQAAASKERPAEKSRVIVGEWPLSYGHDRKYSPPILSAGSDEQRVASTMRGSRLSCEKVGRGELCKRDADK